MERVRVCHKLFAATLLLATAIPSVAGPLQRLPNFTLTNLPPAPPVYGYRITNAFPTLSISGPMAVATPPGETNRLFVLERAGNVIVITNLAAPTRTQVMSLAGRVTSGCEEGLLGITFHPGFATNRYFFLFYSTTASTSASGLHQRVSRFQITATNANVALTNSELPLITQYDEACNHNGGDLHFGPDGYLYASYGDEGQQNDSYNNSQRIDKDFFSGIIRIDVDKRATNLPPAPHAALMGATNYFIPADNPFVGATQFNGTNINTAALRAEFWAVGLRNPWRFSFDDATGTLYCGDVGGSLREEISVILKGGNYGWAYREGTINGPKSNQAPAGFTSVAPIRDYAHGSATNQGNCVTGGVLYRGARISQLTGRYVFADYNSGHVWALAPNGTNPVPMQHLTTDTGIVAFGTDPRNGDVLTADITPSQIGRLVYNTNFTGQALPATLAATGTFTNLTTLAPAAGIVPYDLNLPFWSDNAIKSRWFSVPNTNLTITFDRDGNWSFPTGSVWIKHFELELTNGAPASRKRLETRFIVKHSSGVYGITYRWGSSLTNATLVPEEGVDETFVINEGGGLLRTQVWHYPSRQECLSCHTAAGGFALGFNAPQLNRDFNYDGAVTNQIAALSAAGYFNTNVAGIHTLRALAHPTNDGVSLEYRVRSYLAANCANCHQPGGSALALWDGRIATPTFAAGIINGALINHGGDTNNHVVTPGALDHSVLLTRLAMPGPLRMPPLDSSVTDTQAIALVSAWITNDLPSYQSFADWQIAKFGSTNAADAAATADPDQDRASNYLEFLTATDPLGAGSVWTLQIHRAGDLVQLEFPQQANRAFEVQSTKSLTVAPVWSPLDVPDNTPFFAATNRTATIADPLNSGLLRFYRVRVFEP